MMRILTPVACYYNAIIIFILSHQCTSLIYDASIYFNFTKGGEKKGFELSETTTLGIDSLNIISF